ncbi:MAG TPA: hypothetical protein VGF69_04025 [Thermoanaerobaculia bacterium]|jgi:uncharacterized repeat protein (TIGR01451 family)
MAGNFTLTSLAQLGGTVDWNDNTIWLENGLPTLLVPGQSGGDVVTIAGLGTVTISTPIPNNVTLTILGGTINVVPGGSLTLTGSSTVNSGGKLKLSGGALKNDGTLNFMSTSELRWANGTLSGSGTTFVNAAANGYIEGGGNATLNGQTINVAGGALVYKNNGLLDLSGSAKVIVTGGYVEAQHGGIWTSSDNTGDVKISSACSCELRTPVSFFSIFRIEAQVFNEGAVVANNGSIELAGGGAHTGVFTSTNAGSNISFAGGTHTLNGASFGGAGYAKISSGIVSLSSNITTTVNRFRISGGRLTGSGALNLSSVFEWQGGSIDGSGGAITARGSSDVTGLSGPMVLSGRQLVTQGTMKYSAVNTLRLESNAELLIDVNGKLELEYDEPVNSDGSGRITNKGEIVKLDTGFIARVPPRGIAVTSAGGADLYPAVNSDGGAIRTFEGYLRLAGGGTHNNATFNADSSADVIQFSGGTHTLTGGFTIAGTGPLALSGGTLLVNTPVTIPAANTFVQSGGALGGTADLTNDGAFYWNGGTQNGSARTVNNRELNVTGADAPMVLTGSRQLVNNKDLYYTATVHRLQVNDASRIENNDNLMLSVDSSIDTGGGTTHRIDNFDEIIRIGAGGIFTIDVPVNNSGNGRVQVATGYLELAAGGTSSGTSVGFDLTGNSTKLRLTGGTYTLGAGTTVTMAGASSLFFIDGGTASFSTPLTIPHVYLHTGTLGGTANLTVTETLTWTGGTMAGSGETIVETGALLDASSADVRFLTGRTLRNKGSFNLNPTATLTLTGSTIVNTGTLNLNGDGAIAQGGSGTIVNDGLLRKVGGTMNTGSRLDVPVTNSASGTLSSQVANRNLILAGGGSSSGTIDWSDPLATIDFFGGTFVYNGGPVTGSGILRVNGTGTLQLGAPLSVAQLELQNGGTIDGPANLDITGGGRWSGGTFRGSAATTATIGAGATFDVTDTNLHTLDGRGLTNDGTLRYLGDGTLSVENAAVLRNTNTFDLQSAPAIQTATSGSIVNSGTFKKTAGATANVNVTFTNSGIVNADAGTLSLGGFTQTGGSTNLRGGSIAAVAPLNLTGGTLTGFGTITGSVSNNGANVAPGDAASTATIHLTGSYAQGSTGTMTLKVGGNAAGTFDVFHVDDDLLLGGTLAVNLPGPYIPGNGDVYDVLLFSGTRTSDFATKTLPAFPPDGTFTAAYVPGALRLAAAVTTTANLGLESFAPATELPGQHVTYSFMVTNHGPDTASNVVVNASPAAGLTFAGNSGHCTSAFPCNLGAIPSGQTRTIVAQYLIPTGTPAGTVFTTSATVTSSSVDSDSSNDSDSSTTTVTNANLSITKLAPSTVQAGQHLLYTILVSNHGPDTATGVTVDDSLPADLTFVTNSGDCTTAFPCALGTLTPGQSKSITAKFAVSPAVAAGTVIINTASVSATTPDGDTTNNSSTANTTVTVPNADVAIAKLAPSTIHSGQHLIYTLTITNHGPDTAASVTVNDPTPAGTTFVLNSGDCTTAFPCTIASLGAGQSKTISAKYLVPPSAATGTVISNTATVTSPTADPNMANNSATATTTVTQKADLAVTMTGPSAAAAAEGDTLTYSISVSNAGPGDALGVTLAAPVPANATFVSTAGDCTTAFPCALGTIPAGGTKLVTAQYVAGAGSSISLTATATTTSVDPNGGNDSATFTTMIETIPCPTEGPMIVLPSLDATNVPASGQLAWSHSGAGATYNVFFGPAGSGCATPFASTNLTSVGYENLESGATYEWRVEATNGTCPAVSSSCATFTAGAHCNVAPTPLSPAGGTHDSPVTFSWSAVGGATSYRLQVFSAGSQVVDRTTTETHTEELLPDGAATWFVSALFPNCPAVPSAAVSFNVCGEAVTVIPRVVGQATSGQTYAVEWDEVANAVRYELDEADDAEFTNATTFTIQGNPSKTFTHVVTDAAKGFYYRVRAFSACRGIAGPDSVTVRVVIVPIVRSQQNPGASAPVGSDRIVVQQLFVPGEPGVTLLYQASVDRPWLSVSPASGTLPPEGVTLEVSADPKGLTNGTFSGTVLISTTTASGGRYSTNDGPPRSSTVSINLVTPVRPVLTKGAPPENALIIPSVGHLDGANSHWQSDVRITNALPSRMRYLLTFTPAGGSQVKQTTIDVDAGGTVALDDVVRNWYGFGSLGDSANGLLEIRPAEAQNPNQPLSRVAVASSRTYNVTANGTLGQYIPAMPFAGFIGRAADGALPSLLSLQQIAQSQAYRTNLGLVEASGQPASVLVNVFNAAGERVLQLPVELEGNEQRQLNSFLAEQKLELTDGRIEVQVTGGNGRVTAYASVVDNKTNDPLLVSGVPLGGLATAKHWVLPGVADLNNTLASWRTDMRIFNSGLASQTATLTFFPQNGEAPRSTEVTLQPGEVRTLDNALESVFNLKETGGAVHVTTPENSNLVVSGRTYNLTPNGTYGQFIPAVAAEDGVGDDGRILHILQVEDSSRYRTNLGITEVTGKPAVVEIRVILPDSRVSPSVRVPLAANEFRQFRALTEMGLSNVYNARISVRVVEGAGRVAAYGSVIDMQTQDPTYVPAQ